MDGGSKRPVNFNNQEQKHLCFEDEHCIAFDIEINKKAPFHFLIVPKKIIKLSSATYEDEKWLGHLLLKAKNIAVNKGLHETGYSIIVDEDYGSSRLKCLHVFGGHYISTDKPWETKSRL